MKLTPNTKYVINGKTLTYTGFFADDRHCFRCNKGLSRAHEFLHGNPLNPDSSYYYGSECIKTLNILEA